MKHISELTTVVNISQAREKTTDRNYLDPACVALVDQIFVKLSLLCREYDQLYADDRRLNAEKLQWTMAFMKRGINKKAQIQSALDEIEEQKFWKPPQLGQFLAWCKPSFRKLGLLDKHAAYSLAIDYIRQFSEKPKMSESQETVLKHAIQQTSSFSLRTWPEVKSRPVFERNYEIAVNQFIDGELKEIPLGIEDKTDESQELKKQDEIVKEEYKDVKSKSQAFELMKAMLKK